MLVVVIEEREARHVVPMEVRQEDQANAGRVHLVALEGCGRGRPAVQEDAAGSRLHEVAALVPSPAPERVSGPQDPERDLGGTHPRLLMRVQVASGSS